eukprot:1329957-Rhodomonas_salina.2
MPGTGHVAHTSKAPVSLVLSLSSTVAVLVGNLYTRRRLWEPHWVRDQYYQYYQQLGQPASCTSEQAS